MKAKREGIIAIFSYLDEFTEAIELIKDRSEFSEHVAYSHTSYHELMDVAEEKFGPSEVRWFTLVGALTGVLSGFGMPLWMDYNWPIVVGGKTAGLYSLPAYFVFGFELMILFGALATILGMLVMGRLPDPAARIYDQRLMDDKFGIFVPDVSPEGSEAKLLKGAGAEEVRATS